MSSHILIQNPSDMSSRFSTQDGLGQEESNIEDTMGDLIDRSLSLEIEEINYKKLEFGAISKYLDRIPDREADLIRLYHRDKMKQEQIARLFNITQAAVSYRLHRGIKRIQFLRTIPELEQEEFDVDLAHVFNNQDREILWRMYETTCQSEIAKQMGLTQGRVRHRFFRSLAKIKDLIADEIREKQTYIDALKKHNKTSEFIESAQTDLDNCITNSKYAKYYRVFYAISDKHFNLLHEVKFPQFADRGDAQVLPID